MTKHQSKKIKKLMIDREVSGSEIARRIGYSRQNVNHVINGYIRTPIIRKAIADALDIDFFKLWPDEKERKAA